MLPGFILAESTGQISSSVFLMKVLHYSHNNQMDIFSKTPENIFSLQVMFQLGSAELMDQNKPWPLRF
jgi:hypothetical protein